MCTYLNVPYRDGGSNNREKMFNSQPNILWLCYKVVWVIRAISFLLTLFFPFLSFTPLSRPQLDESPERSLYFFPMLARLRLSSSCQHPTLTSTPSCSQEAQNPSPLCGGLRVPPHPSQQPAFCPRVRYSQGFRLTQCGKVFFFLSPEIGNIVLYCPLMFTPALSCSPLAD